MHRSHVMEELLLSPKYIVTTYLLSCLSHPKETIISGDAAKDVALGTLCDTEEVQEEWVHLIFRSHFGFSTGGCFVVLGTLITTTLIRFVLHATRSI